MNIWSKLGSYSIIPIFGTVLVINGVFTTKNDHWKGNLHCFAINYEEIVSHFILNEVYIWCFERSEMAEYRYLPFFGENRLPLVTISLFKKKITIFQGSFRFWTIFPVKIDIMVRKLHKYGNNAKNPFSPFWDHRGLCGNP